MAALEEDLDRRVDRVVDSHSAVIATLEDDANGLRTSLAQEASTLPGRHLGLPSHKEVWDRHSNRLRLARRERAQRSAGLRPKIPTPLESLDPPLVTRGGVLYVPPRFEEAQGLDEDSALRLVQGGYRSVDTFLSAPDEELVAATGQSLDNVRRAKRDLDLKRLPHVDTTSADLLRLAGCATVSRLAGIDPALLVRDIERIRQRHRFLQTPPALGSERAIRRIIQAAQARSE